MEFSLHHAFAELDDPRQAHKVKQRSVDIIVLSSLAVPSNAQSWTQIEAFGRTKQAWLKDYPELEHGIPTHDTIQRVFQVLPAESLLAYFTAWTQPVSQVTQGRFSSPV